MVSMPHAALCVSGLCVPQPLSRAGCTVLERRNGGMRLCARAGALSISFSSMIAHASFFFNDIVHAFSFLLPTMADFLIGLGGGSFVR